MLEIKRLVLERYEKMPDSLAAVFEQYQDGEKMFFDGLENVLKRRKASTFERISKSG